MTDNAKSPILSKNVSSSIGLEPPLRFPGFEGEWEKKILSDVAYYGKSRHTVCKSDYVSTENMLQDFRGICRYTTSEKIAGIEFEKQNLLLANIRPYLKKVWFANFSGAASTDVLVLKATTIVPGFLKHIIANESFISYVMSAVKGSKMPRGDKSHILNYTLGMPCHDEQQKIADFLSLVDERIEKQRQLVEVLKRYKRGLFSSVYLAKQADWERVCLGDFSKVSGGYAFDSKTYTESGKYSVLTIGNVSGDRYVEIDGCNKVNHIPVDIQQYQILQPNDLVISMTGNVGRVSIVNQNDCLLNQRVAKLDIMDSIIREYVYQVLSCSNFEQEMNNVGQGAAQKNIKNSDIEHFGFCVPKDKKELQTVVSMLLGIDNTILKQEKILVNLAHSKQALLQQMFI